MSFLHLLCPVSSEFISDVQLYCIHPEWYPDTNLRPEYGSHVKQYLVNQELSASSQCISGA